MEELHLYKRQINETEQLETNTFVNQDKHFLKWNTMPDGNGTDYIDLAEVKDLTAVGGEYNLYAIWVNEYYENKGIHNN